MSAVTDVKCVVIGDGAVGKTCMLMSYTQNKFPDDYIATVFDNYESLQVVDGKTVHLQLWDTAGQEEYDRLRSLSFPDTEVFLICFSISDPASFQNIEVKWIPEIKEFIKGVPVILVGTKADFREAPPEGVKLVQKEDAEQMVKRLGLTAYVECSARTQQNLSAVFETAARSVLQKNQPQEAKKSGCCTVL
ncbi:Rac2a, Rho family GTPase [Monocercomonoides exilis]|uniref:Rac2b, Rho family GTPase n=1 Tax=Monocercomonoides exilis TaxID=2049356 RepID=UPI0035595BBA|nr:Rac2b, Rho family GTPase [Monocercomonoides exilis]KAH7826251.1 Rac2a, Rho family GTPase [Monocercomonoides exilis]|eukprot:MONOS_2512.1-p1 / transcript=MONOS_2512.1 / gene=MONOS_2512 / organism=Monocercomonoides_exilis_PA203 / gene_product=Rac2b, Rho family GTPase / transcript_product=Rac2b, Rho family GTPase / location=Mono_scaffold00052:82397-83176(+) / protein_length=191 / sequence_SO=supercontig / SO=protein_coding / is_pseudo=false